MIVMYAVSTFKLVILVTFIQWTSQRSSHHYQKALHHPISDCNRQKASYQVDVFVTVSSLSYVKKDGDVVTRHLEINWHGRKPYQNDIVALYNEDPAITPFSKLIPIAKVNASDHPAGYFRTDIQFPIVLFNLTSLKRHPCMGYWAAYISEGVLHSSSCLQIRPFWMQENKKYLYNQKFSKIMIPGSHDSGCFTPFAGKSTDTLMRYKYAQEEPIFNQLAYGLRYFDFRVGYYPKTKAKYFINHSFFRTDHSLESVLSQVKAFLDATEEIVILDFHLFPVGFESPSVHIDFMNLIYNHLSTYMIPHNTSYAQATLGALWEKNKRVLVAYNNNIRDKEPHGVLWPGLPRAWGNKQYPEDLKLYFQKVFNSTLPDELWASMAELTPNSRFIIIHPKKGLRYMADEINRNVTRWFRDEFWDKANIVATDYFLGNNLVDVAIETNRVKSFCLKHFYKTGNS